MKTNIPSPNQLSLFEEQTQTQTATSGSENIESDPYAQFEKGATVIVSLEKYPTRDYSLTCDHDLVAADYYAKSQRWLPTNTRQIHRTVVKELARRAQLGYRIDSNFIVLPKDKRSAKDAATIAFAKAQFEKIEAAFQLAGFR